MEALQIGFPSWLRLPTSAASYNTRKVFTYLCRSCNDFKLLLAKYEVQYWSINNVVDRLAWISVLWQKFIDLC